MADRHRKCPECGRQLDLGKDGLCPVCLLRLGLDDATVDATSPAADPGAAPPMPERIGPYRVLDRLGEGGMGVVFLAEQVEDLERKVAIKLIKHGIDSTQMLARFDVERQSLALMDHPGIARVLDAGSTERGEPYFVMEYVDGVPITAFCDEHRLATRQRLELFVKVCEAVQHAHRRGVIHRDLKPSNILVTQTDDGPLPKVIDFGVAKATAQRHLEWSVFTEVGALIGTPEYMSPEQADTAHVDVDTRTDVYSLGVVLYELLVGHTPLDGRSLREAGLQAMLREIREQECPAPSSRLSTLGDDSSAVARARSTEPAVLLRQLRGEVDWIVMRAVEKERDRRYDSPSELAADLGRYLEDQAVLAGPPGVAYRARKFLRRHRLGVGLGAIAAVLIVGLAIREWHQARKIARERDRANVEAEASKQVADFMVGLFEVSDPDEARGNSVTAREILDRGAEKIERTLADQPELQARLMGTMGRVYRTLGLYDPAESLLERSLDTRRERLGPEHPETLDTMQERAIVHWLRGDYEKAESMHRRVLEIRERVLGPDHPSTLNSLHNLGLVLDDAGRLEEAAPLYRRAYDGRERVLGPDAPKTLLSRNSLANVSIQLGRYAEGEALHRATLDSRRRVLGDDHPGTLNSEYGVAVTLLYQGKFDDAERLCRETLASRRQILGDEHPETLLSLNLLSVIYQNSERFDQAEPLVREIYETEKRLRGSDSPNAMAYLMNLGTLFHRQNRHAEAMAIFEEVLSVRRDTLGDRHPFTLATIENLAATLKEVGRHDEAEALHLECLRGRLAQHGEEHELTARSLQNLASLYLAMERHDDSREHFERAAAIYERTLAPDHPHVLLNLEGLADVLRQLGDDAAAAEVERKIAEAGG